MMAGSYSPVDSNRPSAGDALDLAPLSLPEMLEQVVARSPQAPLIEFFGRNFSYGEVAAVSRRVATGLADIGIRPGDRVGLFLPNVPYYAMAYHGLLRLGAVAVNFPLSCSTEELRERAEDAGTRVIFSLATKGFLPRAMELVTDGLPEKLIVGSLTGCLSGGKAFLHRLFGWGELPIPPLDGRVSSFDELVDNDGSVPLIGVDPERDAALIQYDAEEGGTARGAVFTHQALTANARQLRRLCSPGRGAEERVIGALPLTEIYGQACVMNQIVAGGGEMVMLSPRRPGEVIAAIRRLRATCLPVTPAILEDLLHFPGLVRADFSSLASCIVAGAPLSQSLRERFEHFSGARLIELHGLFQTGIVSGHPIEGRANVGAIGQPLAATHLALVHRDDPDRESGPGEAGEIIVRGPQLMQGYWHDAAPPPFIERDGQRWLLSGYIGTVDAEGRVQVLDRVRDTISVTGFKVYPSQIEAILCRHPAIEHAVVAGVADHYAGELPKAFVTLAEGATATNAELRSWLNARVGKHEQLVEVEIRDTLPRDPLGQFDRRAVVAQEVPDGVASGAGAA